MIILNTRLALYMVATVALTLSAGGRRPRLPTAATIRFLLLVSMPALLASYGIAAMASSTTGFAQEVSAGIYVHFGQHVAIESKQADDIANIGFIVGDDCVAVVDSGGSISVGKRLREFIRQTETKPVCYVINTHVHYDHVLGNMAFDGHDTEFVGHHDLPLTIESSRQFFLDQFRRFLGPKPDPGSIIAPTHTVDGESRLNLGNRIIVLTSYESAHSHTDLTVFDEKTRTLWTGDLLFRERIPALDGSLRGWLRVMQQLATIDPRLVVPGHGSITDNWPDASRDQARYLNTLLAGTRTAIADGQFMEDALESVATSEKLKWLLFAQHHKRNVSKAFTELEWE